MTNGKTTKRALFGSLMAMLLCVTMLIGSTFAWFTDTASTGVNKIMAGNLNVNLYMYDGSISGTDDKYIDISANKDPIFGAYDSEKAQDVNIDTLWEPGKTQVAYLKIKNDGNLALKYKVALNTINPAESKDLYKAMQYQIVADAKDGIGATWTAGAGKSVTPGTAIVSAEDVQMLPGAEHYFALLIHMDENAGNEYMDGKVEFDISVLATQLNAEADSFGTEYDKDLETSENGMSRVLGDGSTVFYYNEESGFEGRVRLTALPENLGSEYVVPAGVNDLGGVLNGVTLDKLTIPAGIQYAYKSLAGATIGEIVLKDGTTTIPDRMFYKTNVDSVVIPSSVTAIETNAFAQSTPESLSIPASVTTIGDAAFAYMPKLKTVYFESSAALPHYAFRACPKLSTVVFKGDVNIGSTSMIFSNYESGGKDDMTFYVTSDENAENLKTCLGTYNDTSTGSNRNKWTIIVD